MGFNGATEFMNLQLMEFGEQTSHAAKFISRKTTFNVLQSRHLENGLDIGFFGRPAVRTTKVAVNIFCTFVMAKFHQRSQSF